MSAPLIIQASGALGAVCGILLLQAAWRDKTGNLLKLLAGWGAIFASILAFASVGHPDKGSALGLVAMVVAALVVLGVSYARTEPQKARKMVDRVGANVPIGTRMIAKRVGTALLIGPVAGLAALALSTTGFALLENVGLEHTLNLVAAMFAFPLLWAAIGVAVAANTRLWRQSLIAIGSIMAPLAILTLAN